MNENCFEEKAHAKDELEYAQRLIDELSGKGEPKFDRHGNWVNKEIVTSDKLIGIYVDPFTGEEIPSNRAVIVYSKEGAFIYPVKPKVETIKTINLKALVGKNVKLTDIDGYTYTAEVSEYIFQDDNVPEEIEAIVLDYPVRSDGYKYDHLIEFTIR